MKKSLLILALVLAIAAPIAAQAPPQPDGPPPELVLKNVLELSDEQVAALRDLERARSDAAGALGQRIEARQQALSAALSAASPDPGAVGALVISINSLQKQFGDIQEAFETGSLGF